MKKGFKLFFSSCLAFVVAIVLASCANHKPEQAMNQVSLLIDDIYAKNERFNDENQSLGAFVNADIELPYETNVDGEGFVVSYSLTDVTDENSTRLNVNVDAKTAKVSVTQTGNEQKFTLNVTIDKLTKSWDFNVDKLDLSMEVTQSQVDEKKPLTFTEYSSKKSGDDIYIQGYITSAHDYSASYGNGSVWLQDDNGGYYAYRVKVGSQREWDTYFKVGNKLAIKGKLSPYNSWNEVGQGCTYEYIKDAQPKNFEYKDITKTLEDNIPSSKEALELQNQKVSLTGKVVSIPEFDSKEMTLRLKVGANEVKVFVKKAYLDKLNSTLFNDLSIGYTIKVNGITSVNKSLQVCPTEESFYTITSKEVSDADRVAAAISAVKSQDINERYYSDLKDFALLTSFKTADGTIIPITYIYNNIIGSGITFNSEKNTLNVHVDGITSSSGTLTAVIEYKDVAKVEHVFEIKTLTDKDTFDNAINNLTNEIKNNLPSIVSSSSLGIRINLPLSDQAGITVKYELVEPEASKVLKLGEKVVSKTPYIDVIAAPENDAKVDFTLKATVTFKSPVGAENETLTKELTFTIGTMKTFNKFLEFIYGKDGNEIRDIKGVVTGANLKDGYAYVTIQDDNGAYYVRQKVNNEEEMKAKFEKGHMVTISKAEIDVYKGLYQLKLNMKNVTKGKTAQLPAYKTLTAADIKDQAKLKLLLSSLVEVTGVVSEDTKTIIVDGQSIAYYVDNKICGLNKEPEVLKAGQTVKIQGVIGAFNNYQINPITVTVVNTK